MAGRQVPFILFPRFSTFIGPQIYLGLPLDVTAFDGLTLSMWSGPQPGAAPNVTVTLEGSMDRIAWAPLARVVGVPRGALRRRIRSI